jgi:hypothetical protein
MNGKRISRNIKSSAQLFWKRSGGAIFGILLLALIIYLAFTLNIFYVQSFDIEVFEGDELIYVDREEVEDSLVEFIGMRLFQLDVTEVERELSKDFIFIEEAFVSKRVPNSLSIKIVERIPTLNLTKDKISYLLDDEGLVLGICIDYKSYCEKVPVVTVNNYVGEIEVGETPFIIEVDEVIELAGSEKDLGLNIQEFLIPEDGVISVYFEDSTRAIFSVEKDMSEQIDEYSYTRENLLLKNESFKEIDMRFDRPVIRVDKYTY